MPRHWLTAAWLLVGTLMGCQAPPEWWLRSYGSEQGDHDSRTNLAAIHEALASRHLHAAETREPLSNAGAVSASTGRPYAIEAAQPPSAVPSLHLALPSARIVRPPNRLGGFTPSPPIAAYDQRVVPPYTTMVPSPHPGTRCAPDLLGGQRCFSTP
jgi:hypothetical protein